MNFLKHVFLFLYHHIELPIMMAWAAVAGGYLYHVRTTMLPAAKTLADLQFYFDVVAYGFVLSVMVIISMFFKYIDKVKMLTNQNKILQQRGK